MRIFLAVILGLFLLFVLVQIWTFSVKNGQVQGQLSDMSQQLNKAKADQRSIQNDYDYYSNPVNMEKELRARFNFTQPGEKTIILVPKTATTTD